MVVSQLYLLI